MRISYRISFPGVCVGILILSVAVSPRIPLPINIPGRTFDLRMEDLVVAGLVFISSLYLFLKPRVDFTSLGRPIGIYVSVVVFTTCIALFSQPTSSLRIFFYLLKEIEFFLIFLIVANWIRTERELRQMSWVFFIAGGINISWAVYQVITRKYGPFMMMQVPEGVYQNIGRTQVYGISLIGEVSPFASVGVLALLSFLAYGYFLFWKGRHSGIKKSFFLVFGILLTVCSIFTGEKLSIVFFILGILSLAALNLNRILQYKRLFILALLAGLLTGGLFQEWIIRTIPNTERVFHIGSYIIQSDRVDRWKQLVPYGLDHVLTGVGKGSQYHIAEENTYLEEAHNHYIKVFVESGIFGLAAFLIILVSIALLCLRVYNGSRYTISRIVSGTAFCSLVGIGAAALVQDAFKPVALNEVFWIFVGFTAAAERIEKSASIAALEGEIVNAE
jgi:O-antigen ligase